MGHDPPPHLGELVLDGPGIQGKLQTAARVFGPQGRVVAGHFRPDPPLVGPAMELPANRLGQQHFARRKLLAPFPAAGLDAKDAQLDPLARGEDHVLAHGAGLLAPRKDLARHDEDVVVAAAVLDDNLGDASPAPFLFNH